MEIVNLLGRLGWTLRNQKGSHQTWKGPNGERYTLTEKFPKYQMEELRSLLLRDENEK